jgi:hypothetical protein
LEKAATDGGRDFLVYDQLKTTEPVFPYSNLSEDRLRESTGG